MADPINLNQPSKQIVLDLLNRDNQRNLTLAEVDLVDLQANPPQWPRNTRCRVVAIPGSGFTGEREIHYNRLNIGVYFSNTTPAIIADDLDTTLQALPLINQTYNLQLTADDILDELVSGNTHVFKAAPGSFVWTGQVEIEFIPTTGDGLIDLTSDLGLLVYQGLPDPGFTPNLGYDFGETVLTGFDYPQL